MYAVSERWAAAQEEFLAPEGLIEISCYIPELKETLVYTKKDLLSFTHQQTGCVVSGELPKNHIEFSIDNSDGKWNPGNPGGLNRYLTQRLKLNLRYGFVIDGREEWIPGGVFNLYEWNVSPNGFSANFKARDIFDHVIDIPYTGSINGTLYDIATRAISLAGIKSAALLGELVLGKTALGTANISSELKKYTVEGLENNGNESVAVVLQKCANAAGCVMYQDRNGVLNLRTLFCKKNDYVIPKKLSYSYPEIEFSRPIKEMSVTYNGDNVVVQELNDAGETQTLNNELITTKEQANNIARRVGVALNSRQKISGEFRGDPRFDLFDVAGVESKYGMINSIVLTDIKCTFNGAFRIAYSGYVGGRDSVRAYCGELFAGEVT